MEGEQRGTIGIPGEADVSRLALAQSCTAAACGSEEEQDSNNSTAVRCDIADTAAQRGVLESF